MKYKNLYKQKKIGNVLFRNMNQSDDEISRMSKETFKVIVRKSAERKAVEHLNSIAKTHSKSKDLASERQFWL